jgi:hypothetical protein
MMKKAAKKLLRATGFELRRVNQFEPKTEDTFRWMRNLNIRTVLDVGANIGQFADQIHTIVPEAAIYSFEPLPECCELLVRRTGFSLSPKSRGASAGAWLSDQVLVSVPR